MEPLEVCEKCGQPVEIGQWPFCPHGGGFKQLSGSLAFPFTTSHIDGTPRTFSSDRELQSFCKANGVVHRPDNAFIEKRVVGTDWKTGKQIWSEGSGRGMKGSWI